MPVVEPYDIYVRREASHRTIALLIVPTAQAIEALQHGRADTNAILHVTC